MRQIRTRMSKKYKLYVKRSGTFVMVSTGPTPRRSFALPLISTATMAQATRIMTHFGSLDREPDKNGKKHMFYSHLRWLYNLEVQKASDPKAYRASVALIKQIPVNMRPISDDPVTVLQALVDKAETYLQSLLTEKTGKRKRAAVA